MTENSTHITLFAADTADGAGIAEVAAQVPGVTLTRKEMTLSKANGTAHRLAAAGEIVLFRASTGDGDELEAVRSLCAAADKGAGVIAISDADMPLSEVRRLIQAGVADVLPMPLDAGDLKAVLERMAAPVAAPAQATGRGKIITVAQARGGIGSTTFAVNLADALRGEAGLLRKVAQKRVAIVDLDLQFGGIASFLDVEPNEALHNMALDGILPDATFVQQALVRSKGGLSVLTAPTDFVPLDSLSPGQVDALLDHLALSFDYVVVDLPRTLVHWVQAVLNRTDRLYLVTDSTVPSVRQSKRLVDAYAEENPTLPIEIVVNFEAKPLVKGRHHVQAAKLLERELKHWLPPEPKIAREALDRGVPMAAVSGRTKLMRSIRKIAAEVIALPSASAAAPAKPATGATDGPVVKFSSRKSKEGSARV